MSGKKVDVPGKTLQEVVLMSGEKVDVPGDHSPLSSHLEQGAPH